MRGHSREHGRDVLVELRRQSDREKEAARQTKITLLKAVAADPEIHWMADRIDCLTARDTSIGGRPRSHPTWALVVFGSAISIFGSAAEAARNLKDPDMWAIVVRCAGPLVPTDAVVPPRGPERYQWEYFLRHRLRDQQAPLLKGFSEGAARRASEVGLADPGTGSINRIYGTNAVIMDGKVFTSPIGTREASRVDRKTGEILPVRRDHGIGQHYEGGDVKKPVWGHKFALACIRSPFAGHRVILGIQYVPDGDGHGENGAFVDLALDIAARLPGVSAFITDGALRGNQINEIQQGTGAIHVSIPRRHDGQHGGIKIGDTHYAARRLPASKSRDTKLGTCNHDLWAAGGTIVERHVTADGTDHWVPLRRGGRKRQELPGGTWNILVEYRLPCPDTDKVHRWHEPLTSVGTDGPAKFIRAEYLRGISADDPDFDRVYGMRSDVESLNAQLEHAFHKQRIPALGTANKTMILMFAAMTQNAWARHAWLREVDHQAASPPGSV
jgi:hypothetical protein